MKCLSLGHIDHEPARCILERRHEGAHSDGVYWWWEYGNGRSRVLLHKASGAQLDVLAVLYRNGPSLTTAHTNGTQVSGVCVAALEKRSYARRQPLSPLPKNSTEREIAAWANQRPIYEITDLGRRLLLGYKPRLA